MRTVFGKHLLKIRVDRDMLLKDLADMLNVTSAYLSAVETGRKPISEKTVSKICGTLELTEEECQNLRRSAEESKNEISVIYSDQDQKGRKLAIAFARRFNNLIDDEKLKLLESLEEAKV